MKHTFLLIIFSAAASEITVAKSNHWTDCIMRGSAFISNGLDHCKARAVASRDNAVNYR